jgi:hypothetical protein
MKILHGTSLETWEITRTQIQNRISNECGQGRVKVLPNAEVYINYGKPNQKFYGRITFHDNNWEFRSED